MYIIPSAGINVLTIGELPGSTAIMTEKETLLGFEMNKQTRKLNLMKKLRSGTEIR